MKIYIENVSLKLSKFQNKVLGKLDKDKSKFIREALQEKVAKEYPMLLDEFNRIV